MAILQCCSHPVKPGVVLERQALKVEEEADFTASVATHDNCIRRMIMLMQMRVLSREIALAGKPQPNPTLA